MAGNGARATTLKPKHSDNHCFLLRTRILNWRLLKDRYGVFWVLQLRKILMIVICWQGLSLHLCMVKSCFSLVGQIGGLICSLRCYLDTATSKCVYIVMVTLKWASGKAILKQTCLLQALPPQDTKDHPVVVVVDQAVLQGEEVQSLIFLVYLILLDRKNPNKMLEVVSKATQVLCTLPLRLRAPPVHMRQTTQVAIDL